MNRYKLHEPIARVYPEFQFQPGQKWKFIGIPPDEGFHFRNHIEVEIIERTKSIYGDWFWSVNNSSFPIPEKLLENRYEQI